jgi:hypothetical protein
LFILWRYGARLIHGWTGHDATTGRVATDDDRSTAQFRAIPLLDGREERVEIDVQDRALGHAT